MKLSLQLTPGTRMIFARVIVIIVLVDCTDFIDLMFLFDSFRSKFKIFLFAHVIAAVDCDKGSI